MGRPKNVLTGAKGLGLGIAGVIALDCDTEESVVAFMSEGRASEVSKEILEFAEKALVSIDLPEFARVVKTYTDANEGNLGNTEEIIKGYSFDD